MAQRSETGEWNRREILKKSGFAVATSSVVGLAGCSGGDGGSGDGESSDGSDGSDGGSSDGGSSSTPSSDDDMEGSDSSGVGSLSMSYSAPAAAGDVTTWYGPREIASQEYGLETTINVFEGIDLAIQSVLAGQTDIARGSTTAAATIIETGKPFKMIGATASNTDYVLVTSPDITSLQDIVDQDAVVGMSAPTGLDVVQLAAVMFEEGVIEDTSELNLQRIGYSSARQNAMLNGDIDVSPQHYGQWLTMREENPDLNNLFSFGDRLDNWVQEVYMAPEEAINEKPEELTALLKGLITGHRNMYNEGFSLYSEMVNKYVPGGGPPEEQLQASFEFLSEIEIWPRNGGLTEDDVDKMLSTANNVGLTEERVPTDDAMDRSLLDSALEDIGTV
jgi:ABC-type nitrate/sulfonate/bicarbonate transport system substrate-binding protein